MFYAKKIIVLGVVALTMGQHVAAYMKDSWATCNELQKPADQATLGKPTEALDKAELSSNIELRIKAHTMTIEVMDSIVNNEQCSDWSLEYLELISDCRKVFKSIQTFSGPIGAYADKCLTPEYVSQKVKSGLGDTARSEIDLLSGDFIEKFSKRYPDFKLVLPHGPDDNRDNGVMKQAYPIAIEAISERNPELIRGNKDSLAEYLQEKVFAPCKRFKNSASKFMETLRKALVFYKAGSQEELIAELDQEAWGKIFRYLYCDISDEMKYSAFELPDPNAVEERRS